MISTLQISVLLDYWKDCFRKIFKGIKINKSCFVFLVTFLESGFLSVAYLTVANLA